MFRGILRTGFKLYVYRRTLYPFFFKLMLLAIIIVAGIILKVLEVLTTMF